MITDLFSHKIHASKADWADKLVELTQVFSEFDGHIYDRSAIEQRLSQFSPRSAYAPRDVSKFRDEISAYPTYLGLYYLMDTEHGWVLKLTETAKHFLLREDPDVPSFLRLQLALFQYPNASGAVYSSTGNSLHLQSNAADRTLAMIAEQTHISPLRLICKMLQADAQIKSIDLCEAHILYEEVYALANYHSTNRTSNPDLSVVMKALSRVRTGEVTIPPSYERRFKLLEHTGLFRFPNAGIALRQPENEADRKDILDKINAILAIKDEFKEFDKACNRNDLQEAIRKGGWGRYFDGVRTLSGEIVQVLATDLVDILYAKATTLTNKAAPTAYSLINRPNKLPMPKRESRHAELTDPEITKIKRERCNLTHKMLLDRMHDMLHDLGCTPKYSPHIDLYAEIPGDGAFIFEAKSGGESLLEQVRKGLSQLYEYRYRYIGHVNGTSELCLVLGEAPDRIPWLENYLCEDRKILVCWFDETGKFKYPPACGEILGVLSGSSKDIEAESNTDCT